VRFEDPDYNRKFRDEIDKITDKKDTMDIFEIVAGWRLEEAREEGLKKGLEKGLEKAVKALLANTKFSIEKIASEVGVPVSFVENIKKNLQANP
jgi:flagellar biosynthesis/type III secretory pathway protein FliH